MDLSNPLAVVTPTLDAGVLQVLAATTSAATVAEIHRRLGRGSGPGVRRVLARLVDQGIVNVESHGPLSVYGLNRCHVAAPHLVALTQSRAEIIRRIKAEIDTWRLHPWHASLFGSFARGEAGVESDIDVLIVRESTHDSSADDIWVEQLDALALGVRSWTGNEAQVIDLSRDALTDMVEHGDPLVDSWRADSVHLVGHRLAHSLKALT